MIIIGVSLVIAMFMATGIYMIIDTGKTLDKTNNLTKKMERLVNNHEKK